MYHGVMNYMYSDIRADIPYPAAGNQLIENRWTTKLCSLSVVKHVKQLVIAVRIHVRLGSKCHVK